MSTEEGQLDMLAALEAVEAAADDTFMLEAAAALDTVIARLLPFTTEDVKELVSSSTHEPRVWGALIRRAALEGRIRKTGRQVKARNRKCHARDMTEWVSTKVAERAA